MASALLTLDEVIELKELVKERFHTDLHYHDTCGGQSFEVDNMTPEMRAYFTGYFDALDLRTAFSDTDGIFSVAP